MGSVKDLKLLIPAYENNQGYSEFNFSDRYSVFDWGEMPDQINNKGRALAMMSAYNFEELEKKSIKTHYNGLIFQNKLVKFSNIKEGSLGSNRMEVRMAVKYNPIQRKFLGEDNNPQAIYDYSFFENNRGKLNNFLIPLEIIFRNGLPKGSSVFKKLKEAEGNQIKTKTILDKLGLKEIPEEGDMLPKPVLGYTTKLEEGDRHLSDEEAYQISGLTREQFSKVKPLALEVNDFITQRCEETGLAPHWDGKVEMIYNNGLCLADVLGTLDEDRMGDRISKEFLRQWYKKNQPEFAVACDEWKKTGEGWQARCPVKPTDLPYELSKLVSQMYMSACNQYIGKNIFPDVPELKEVMERLKVFRD